MFARLFAVASLAALAVAGPAPLVLRDQCNTGSISCCNSVQDAESANNILSSVGLNILAGVVGQVGINCSPISVVGGGAGAKCTQQPVCCTNDHFSGLINIGCTNLDL